MSFVLLVITCGRLLRKILNNIHVARALWWLVSLNVCWADGFSWSGARRWAWRNLTLSQMMSDGSSRCFINLRLSSNLWFPLLFLDLSMICGCNFWCKKLDHYQSASETSWCFLVFKAQGIHCSKRPARHLPTAPIMERVKRIAAHVNGSSLTSEPCSAAIPVMESMKTKIAALAGGI